MDKHYTPVEIARDIVGKLAFESPRCAADFAAGEGALLGAILERWPKCKLVATDIDPFAVRKLRQRFHNVDAGVCDFLNGRSRAISPVLKRAQKRVTLGFINPPFSCRGGARHPVQYKGIRITCSRAMAFLINSLPYLESQGKLIAILPASCLTSEKDADALSQLSRDYTVEVLGGAEPYKFNNCRVHISFVGVTQRIEKYADPSKKSLPLVFRRFGHEGRAARLSRGQIAMHTAEDLRASNGIPLVLPSGSYDSAARGGTRVY
jgi:hypothetical protein